MQLLDLSQDTRGGRLLSAVLADPSVRGRNTEELEASAMQAAQARIHEDPDYEQVAAYLLRRRLYRDVLGTPEPSAEQYRAALSEYVRRGVRLGALDERLLRFRLDTLAEALQPHRDELIPLAGLYTLADRYLVRHPETRELLELPQFLPVRGINGTSSGIIPFVHLFDALIKAVSQGGRRRGTLAVYLEPWHLEIRAFLDLKRNSGDPYLRAHSLNTALWVPDEFLRRVERDDAWYLFDPQCAPELSELWGEAFREAYERRVHEARSGLMPERAFRVERARDLFREILATLQETSHPWIAFKDASNARSMLPGVIHSSNLCTEVHLPTSPEEMAVCNLASVNLSHHLTPEGMDWDRLRRTVRLAMRGLDNVVDVNLYPTERAARSNRRHRPVGLGIMGLAEVFARLGMRYGDDRACEFTDRVVEFIGHCAIEASCDLAAERGAFPSFRESRWAQGCVPVDTLGDLIRLRGGVDVDQTVRMPWEALRRRVREGIRNGTVLAIAPTATISLIAGTTPGIDPYYANLFARQTLSGKFLEVNRVLAEQLRAMGLWERVRERLVEARGDVSELEELGGELRDLHRTAYQIPPEDYVRVAARAQKWVDQGISRNLYLQDRSLQTMERVYLEAWRSGLKSTYYLFTAPRMYAEPSTVRVNKAARRLRWNLEQPEACSLSCESCAS